MANDPIQEMIAAFAVGCMDKENFIQFKDYFTSGGELPKDELGDLQNIVAMIPVILDLEQPNPLIKDNVAKKLISLKDEIKTRIKEEKTKSTQTFATPPTFTANKTRLGNTFATAPSEEMVQDSKPTLSFLKPKQATRVTQGEFINKSITEEKKHGSTVIESVLPEKPQTLFPQQQQQPVLPPQPQEKPAGGLAGWLAVILTLLLFTIVGYYTYVSVAEVNDKVADLERTITAMKSDLTASNNFVSNYMSLIEFFNNKDVVVVNLSPIEINSKASARVFLAFDQKEGLIQFKNARALPPNQGYQVWVVSKNQSYSLGVYSPNSSEYLRLSSFPFLPKEQIDKIRVTIESSTGSPTPSVDSYLEGTFVIKK